MELSRGSRFQDVSDESFVLKAGKEMKVNLFVCPNVVERFAIRELEKIQLAFMCINDFNEKYRLILDIEGTAKIMGNNRCEGQLIPCAEPVKWKLRTEKEEKCI